MTQPTQKFQRKTVLVKRSLQLRYIAMVFLSVLVASMIVGGVLTGGAEGDVLTLTPPLDIAEEMLDAFGVALAEVIRH